tara:strand:+ start:598 stop:1818 length:1221 start_codon:yes stop_codon:yes gene_type:complete
MALTAQQQAIQNQINAFDSNTGTQLLLSTLLQAINAGDVRQGYADSAAFPTDSAFIGMIGFDDFDSSLRFVGRDLIAHKIDSADIVASGPSAAPYEGSPYQGLSRAYVFGGNFENEIQKVLYASDGNATDVADAHPSGLLGAMPGISDTHGYLLGGRAPPAPSHTYLNTIQRFPYASEGNAADTGYDLVQPVLSGNLSAIGNRDKIYNTGGSGPAAPDHYERISHSSLSNATDVGNLTPTGQWGQYMGGASSTTKGYSLGGRRNGDFGTLNYYSFPFASEGNMVDTANLSVGLYYNSGASSNEDGYSIGGQKASPPSSRYRTIDKFPFAAEGDASSSSDMQLNPGSGINRTTASSSPSFGYVYGGNTGPGAAITDIQKFPFASVATIADVGDLITTENRDMGATDV